MMRKKSVLFLMIISAVVFCGCGNKKAPEADAPASAGQQAEADGEQTAGAFGDKTQGDGSTEAGAEEDMRAGEGAGAGQEDADGTAPEEADTLENDTGKPVRLTQEEIQFFTEFIQKMENYGFLLSAYDAPGYVNLDEVFYSGAGIDEPMSDEEISAYLAAFGQEELYTDCIKIPRERMEAFLQKKLGIGLEDMGESFGETFAWRYLPEYDAYYHEAGDTNYTSYECVGGTKEGDLYTLHFHTDWFWDDPRSDRETVLRKDGEEYQFVSNHYVDGDAVEYESMNPEVRAAYAEALQNLLENLILPDGTQVELDPFWEDRPNENEFCIADVDGDGREELLVAVTTTYVAGMVEEVYEYDPDTQVMRKEFQEFPNVTYFDNGMILAGWSHNHTYGDDLWPYNMYRYDADSDNYLYMGCVTSWQKSFQPEGYPDDVDVSGTGTVYAVTPADEGVEDFCYNQEQYAQFYEETFGAADEVELQWHLLIDEELDLLSADL